MLSRIIPFITRTCYRKEMILVLSLKFLATFMLWALFFSEPIDHRLTKIDLMERYLTHSD